MCDALRELMKPEMDEAIDKAVTETENTTSKNVAKRMIRAGKYSDEDIVDVSGLTLSQVKVLREEMKQL